MQNVLFQCFAFRDNDGDERGVSIYDESNMTFSLPSLALVAANLVPLAGVVFIGWDASIIILLYWTENLIIGFYNSLKIVFVQVSDPPVAHFFKIFPIFFFWLHFGGFCGMHGLFIIVFFKIGTGTQSIFPSELWPGPLAFVHLLVNTIAHLWLHHPKGMVWPVLCLFASHGISFVQNYLGQKEYQHLTIRKLMTQPYTRIFIMHITVIAGGWIIMLLESPMIMVTLFVLGKIALDFYFHTRQHNPVTNDTPRVNK